MSHSSGVETSGQAIRFTTALIFGVIIPVLALGFELAFGICGSFYVDPIPTLLHAILIAWVPCANLALLLALRNPSKPPSRMHGWANAITIGISGYYSLLFIPLAPFAAIAILYFGAGLLPLSPMMGLLVAIKLRIKAAGALTLQGKPGLPGLWRGMAVPLLLVACLETPNIITNVGMRMAASESPVVQSRAIRLLRVAGRNETLLENCYMGNRLHGGPVNILFHWFGSEVSAEQVQIIYYQVTGTPFNMEKPPSGNMLGRRHNRMMDFDPDVGGDAVQRRIRGLSLLESRLDSVVFSRSATAYTEWVMVFRNESWRPQEARMMVLLPPGGVVSRLTLWVDGEEREAAFAGKSHVKEAYQRVVRRNQDPVLVTLAGPDTVLVQCFPVPANGGTMKIRFGITAPLDLDSPSSGMLRMPLITEHNFNVPEIDMHGIWIESDNAMLPAADYANISVEQAASTGSTIRGTLPGTAVLDPFAIRATRSEALVVEAVDQRAAKPAVVRQTIRQATVTMPLRLVLVIDGSRRMALYRDILKQAVASIPDGLELGVLLAGDAVEELLPPQAASEAVRREAADAISRIRFAGGCNNVAALRRAWDIAAADPNGAILWLHATQPVNFAGTELLLQRWERRPDSPTLYGLQLGTGPNSVMTSLGPVEAVSRMIRSGDPASDLAHRFALWSGEAIKHEYLRTRHENIEPDLDVHAGSSHVVRLWANGEIGRLARQRDDGARSDAVSMAAHYQLVTSVSGAVVLETEQQYKEAGLEPVSADSVPVVPEPQTWILLGIGLIVMLLATYQQRARARCVVEST